MIIEYDKKYDEEIKNLLVQLQEYIKDIDLEGYNRLTEEYRELYFKKTIEDINKYNGKMLLYKDEEKILGLVVGIINNDDEESYDLKIPKRGRGLELVVSKEARLNGIGSLLLSAMENYLKSNGCKDILLGVFAYNDDAIKFYKKHGYHIRMHDMTKSDI